MIFLNRFRPYLIWACAALFYMYQFIIRVSPSVMLDDLMVFFSISASEVGVLSALALYSYSILQIPAGILADILGVRRVILGSILFCITGVLLFIAAPNLFLAKLGRCLIGAGSAAAFLCVSKVSAEWFPPERRATLLGMTMAVGTVGALNGGAPLSYSVSIIGWRQTLLGVAVLGVFVFAMSLILLKDKLPAEVWGAKSKPISEVSPAKRRESLNEYMTQILLIFKNKICWLNGMTALGIYLCIAVIADLWGISFLVQTYGFTKQTAAQYISLIYVGLCVGSLSLTTLSDYLNQKKFLIGLSVTSLLFFSGIFVYCTDLPYFVLAVCLFLIGFFSGAEMLCFASACENSNPSFSGTVTGFINCVVMLGGAFIQEGVGKLLDYFWSGQLSAEGIRVYTTYEYQLAMTLIIATIGFSSLVSMFLPGRKPLAKRAHPFTSA